MEEDDFAVAFFAISMTFIPKRISIIVIFSKGSFFMHSTTANTNTLAQRSMDRSRRLASLAMLSAIAYAVMLFLRVPFWSFLSYDPKDIVIVISGFIYGPFSAFLISFVVSFIEMITASDTGWIGFAMNLLSTCSFACVAGYVYGKIHTKNGAVIGLALGVVLMTAVMLLWNYLITPMYLETTREVVASMLVPIFLPFNLLKGGLNLAITLIIYKPIITALRKASLLPKSDAENSEKTYGTIILGVVVLVTVLLIVVVAQGII